MWRLAYAHHWQLMHAGTPAGDELRRATAELRAALNDAGEISVRVRSVQCLVRGGGTALSAWCMFGTAECMQGEYASRAAARKHQWVPRPHHRRTWPLRRRRLPERSVCPGPPPPTGFSRTEGRPHPRWPTTPVRST